jgi:hypothetical protein
MEFHGIIEITGGQADRRGRGDAGTQAHVRHMLAGIYLLALILYPLPLSTLTCHQVGEERRGPAADINDGKIS